MAKLLVNELNYLETRKLFKKTSRSTLINRAE